MDPDVCLERLRELIGELNDSGQKDDGGETYMDLAAQVADGFQALDGWLSAGGFRPRAWAGATVVHVDPAEPIIH